MKRMVFVSLFSADIIRARFEKAVTAKWDFMFDFNGYFGRIWENRFFLFYKPPFWRINPDSTWVLHGRMEEKETGGCRVTCWLCPRTSEILFLLLVSLMTLIVLFTAVFTAPDQLFFPLLFCLFIWGVCAFYLWYTPRRVRERLLNKLYVILRDRVYPDELWRNGW